MTTAITIGSFHMKDHVKLNILQTKKVFPDSPILICDDRSDNTDAIRDIADENGCYFQSSNAKRGHFAGDWQCMVSSLSFAEQQGCEIALKLSQRLVPAQAAFKDFIEKPFKDPKINIVVPGRISAGSIRLTNSRFFSGFGILSCVIAFRVGSITPKQILDHYVSQYKFGRYAPDNIPEVAMGKLLATHFQNSAFVSMDLANHKPLSPFIFLRRTQCDARAYQLLAAEHGFEGEFDTRELAEIFRGTHLSRPVLVT